jgi:hypothetical protein
MYNFKEHLMPENSFIGGWYIDENICDEIVDYYNKNNHLQQLGNFGKDENSNFVDKDVKESIDLNVSKSYLGHPFYNYRKQLNECLSKYIDKYNHCNSYSYFNINEDYLIQKYPIGGGYKSWHFEKGSIKVCKRLLVFMTYLNTVENGGTEFLYQKLSTPAKKGLTLIWPSQFTHTHKGIVSLNKEKIIITGWYSFNE